MKKRKNNSDQELISCLVCDSIRQEITGKQTIVGVYGDDIIMHSTPGQLLLSLYIRCIFSEDTIYKFKLRVIDSKKKEITTTEMTRHGMQNKTSIISIESIPITVSEPGIIEFQWKMPNMDLETIEEVNVTNFTELAKKLAKEQVSPTSPTI